MASEQKPELTEAQERTKEKVVLLSQDPNAAPRDMASAKAAAHFNDRAHGVDTPKETKAAVSGQQEKGAVNDNGADKNAGKEKPEPVQKPESQRRKGNYSEAFLVSVMKTAKAMSERKEQHQEKQKEHQPHMGR